MTVSDEWGDVLDAGLALKAHVDALDLEYDLRLRAPAALVPFALLNAHLRFGGVVTFLDRDRCPPAAGAIARSLVLDARRWLWLASDPRRHPAALQHELLAEQERLRKVIAKNDLVVPYAERWLQPIPQARTLTVATRRPAPTVAFPDRKTLARHVFTSMAVPLLERAAEGMRTRAVAGADDVLDHCAHGNHLGMLVSFGGYETDAGEGSPYFAALLVHNAASAVAALLVAAHVVSPSWWPQERVSSAFLDVALDLAADVRTRAVRVHGMTGVAAVAPARGQPRTPPHVEPSRLPDTPPPARSAGGVLNAATNFTVCAAGCVRSPFESSSEPVLLFSVLAEMFAHDAARLVVDLVRLELGPLAAFPARMVLEEAARMHFLVAGQGVYAERAEALSEDLRHRRRAARNAFATAGVPKQMVDRLFALPRNVVGNAFDQPPAPGRPAVPSVAELMRIFSKDFPEPGWLELAYGLLSQVVHASAVGVLHTVDDTPHGFEPVGSPEVLALSLDAACLGAACVLDVTGAINGTISETERRDLLREAMVVHDAARLVHQLD